jgi:mRNA interferase MazF
MVSITRIRRGDIWQADLGEPRGSQPGYTRPVLVMQDNRFNDSNIATVVVIALTSNMAHAQYPGNVVLPKADSGLDRDSIINVTQIVTVDKAQLTQFLGSTPQLICDQVEYGMALILGMK